VIEYGLAVSVEGRSRKGSKPATWHGVDGDRRLSDARNGWMAEWRHRMRVSMPDGSSVPTSLNRGKA